VTIKENETLPDATLFEYKDKKIDSFKLSKVIEEKKIVIFALPGAFTPTCSEKHLPGYVLNAEKFFKKGVDEVWCLAVNDPFVMYAWGLVGKSLSSIRMVSDGNCEFTKKIGLDKDLGAIGFGLRSMRYAMVVEGGKVLSIFVEDDPGQLEKSDAQSVLASL
jgi:peroxiredoxin (alkyl hydroperoxide reductase subunit C)